MNIDIIINSFVTMLAAFGGAFFAFLFERFNAEKREEETRIASGNLALFTIFNQIDLLRQFQNNFIEPWREKNDAWLNMEADLALTEINPALRHFNFAGLNFLLSGSNPNILAELALTEQNFQRNLDLINKRNDLIVNQVHPTLARAGILRGNRSNEIESCLGNLTHQLKCITSGIIKNTDENITNSEKTARELRSCLIGSFHLGGA